MKILFNSIHLFLFSLYVDFYKYRFDRAVKKRLKNGKDISTKKLTQMSDKCYYLFNSFIEKEKRLRLKMQTKPLWFCLLYFWEFEVLTSLKIISGDMCGRNGLKSKVSTLEELYDFFSEKILKNYIYDVIFGADDRMSTGSKNYILPCFQKNIHI